MSKPSDLIVSLHNFDSQGNCYADIILPVSGVNLKGFKVKRGLGEGIIVYMPSKMRNIWKYSEIKWEEVRKQITNKYNEVYNNKKISVKLYNFDEKNNCSADIVLCEKNIVIDGFVVKRGMGQGIIVHRPSWLNTRWSYPDIQWQDVRQLIAREYLSFISGKQHIESPNNTIDEPHTCKFYSSVIKIEADVNVILLETKENIQGIKLIHTKNNSNTIQVDMSEDLNSHWKNSTVEWNMLVEMIIREYNRNILGLGDVCKSANEIVKIDFSNINEITYCIADIILPNKKNTIRGFNIKKLNRDNKIVISIPKSIGRLDDSRVSCYELCSIILNEFREYERNAEYELNEQNSTGTKKEKNELGRIKNAENSSFIFYPRTVLRAIESQEEKTIDSKKKLSDLVLALNKGASGGLGPFEINILEWIAKLRYTTSIMILDLIQADYISFGWRRDITQSKLSKIISRMAEYNLITLTKFMTVNDDGSTNSTSRSVMRIITLGKNGSTLLHELGRNIFKFNPFDIFQDGNTVKRYLTANQWLIYWLQTYKEEIGDHYETSRIIHLKGIDYIGVRIYATVTVNDFTMIAEPIRRVEDFEIERNKQSLQEKINRLFFAFENKDQLYHGKDELHFSMRPIIVLICEDDNHIYETWETVKVILSEDNRQSVWFSSDLRIFNYDKEGERFLCFNNDVLQPIDIKQSLKIN